jgi:hypothetical protein
MNSSVLELIFQSKEKQCSLLMACNGIIKYGSLLSLRKKSMLKMCFTMSILLLNTSTSLSLKKRRKAPKKGAAMKFIQTWNLFITPHRKIKLL